MPPRELVKEALRDGQRRRAFSSSARGASSGREQVSESQRVLVAAAVWRLATFERGIVERGLRAARRALSQQGKENQSHPSFCGRRAGRARRTVGAGVRRCPREEMRFSRAARSATGRAARRTPKGAVSRAGRCAVTRRCHDGRRVGENGRARERRGLRCVRLLCTADRKATGFDEQTLRQRQKGATFARVTQCSAALALVRRCSRVIRAFHKHEV